MTNNDIDVDVEDDLDKDLPSKPSLKETWDSNPMLKIAAVVLTGAVLVGGYMTFMGGEEEGGQKSVVQVLSSEGVQAAAGKGPGDAAQQEAVRKQNEKEAQAAQTGNGSFMPESSGDNTISSLSIPEQEQAKPDVDPLQEWRTRTEMTRQTIESKIAEEEEAAPAPDVAPMVQPIRPQAQAKPQDAKAAQSLAIQMRTLIAAQVPLKGVTKPVTKIESDYMAMKRVEAAELADLKKKADAESKGLTVNSNGTVTNSKGKKIEEKVIVPAGSVVYAQLMNQLNSDIDSPALVQIMSGPFTGGRAIGKFKMVDEYLTLTFTKVIKDGVAYTMNGVALDEETTLAAHASDVDHHYFARVILPAAAKFIEGYAAAVAETGTSTTTTSGGGVATETPEPNANEEFLAGVEEASTKVSEIMDKGSEKPITVHLNRGVTMGILMVDSVTTGSAGK